MNTDQAKQYWRLSLKLAAWTLAVWFLVSFGFGIVLVDWLNQIQIGGYKLGFWFAQQGAIYAFVLIIFIYVRKMASLDARFDANKEEDAKKEDVAIEDDR